MVSQINIDIKRYESKDKIVWDRFVSESKNGTFLIYRDFMEYHSDRFGDHSLLFYHKDTLIAILPANIDETTLHSHQGLTYGGVVMSSKVTTSEMLEVFPLINKFLKSNGIQKVIYNLYLTQDTMKKRL